MAAEDDERADELMTKMLRLKQGISRLYYQAAQLPLGPILRYEWSRRDQRRVNERPIEYGFALRSLSGLAANKILDVGTGATAWPQLLANCGYSVTAIDEGASYWGAQPLNRHHHVLRDDITRPALDDEFDVVTCLSVLEHVRHHQAAIRNIRHLLRLGGHALVSFPYNERRYVENVYALPGVSYGTEATYICRVFSRRELSEWLPEGFDIVEQRYYRVFSGDLWAFGERLRPPVETSVAEPHHLTCLLMRAT